MIQTGKEEFQLFVHAYNYILKGSTDLTKKFLDEMNTFRKVARYKFDIERFL